MRIRSLPSHLINQIAAGEVVERPASVLKELIENALDAGATDIKIWTREGGKSLLVVQDNGCGMSPEEMEIALERHTTSKLPEEDLWNIKTFGFRGEALPAIASVSRLTLIAAPANTETGWKITVEGGIKGKIEPVPYLKGTRIEVRDLFFATPARLKFLKSDTTETSHILDVVTRLAIAHPQVSFSLKENDKEIFSVPIHISEKGFVDRLRTILGQEFAQNSLEVTAIRNEMTLKGLISLPTLSRSTTASQYFYVNGRMVRDKTLQACIRDAYQDVLFSGRHPMLALFLEMPLESVDVNVHPAKTEVRFRDSGPLRGLILGALKNTLAEAGHKTSTTLSQQALGQFSQGMPQRSSPFPKPFFSASSSSFVRQAPLSPPSSGSSALQEERTPSSWEKPSFRPFEEEKIAENIHHPLGAACAQIHETYILSQTQDGFVIVDQHAAHERLVYEKLKASTLQDNVQRQLLLIPEVIELSGIKAPLLLNRAPELEAFGLLIESFGEKTILVREIPALLGEGSLKTIIEDLAEEIEQFDKATSLKEHLHEICSSLACHGSIRAGKQMTLTEMNALLRQMESTAFSGQCNHGRPTYIELKLKDIERLFHRT